MATDDVPRGAQRLLTGHPTSKALFKSGYSADIITRQDVSEEGLNFIQKPFIGEALARKVCQVLEGKQPGPGTDPRRHVMVACVGGRGLIEGKLVPSCSPSLRPGESMFAGTRRALAPAVDQRRSKNAVSG